MRLGPFGIAFTFAAFSHVAVAANLQPPVNRTAGAETQVFWTVSPRDHASWTLFLMDPAHAFGLYAILGRNIDTSLGYANITLPATLDPR
ncbi:hypothetical protein CVT25_007128 [Psilocybe cyanescens]|uniref:DOMON domain-containing protein n=1 Tax=Psilocybe cyanescens TaxID=93625 RepID=A0A409XIJ1_PSICY|nr:hypothetical protein CVT25_007128 [Psilocybe cyanescens]